MRRRLALILGFLALALAFTYICRFQPTPDGDPDRYYHIALSRLTAESGHLFLRALPQVEDLGWSENFVDKEFLFHQITTLGYRLAGARGVVDASFLCAFASLLLFFLYACGRLSPLAAIGATLLTFSSPLLAFRLALLRPHVLAILAFLLMNIAILWRKPKLTAIAALFFTLSYHAFYMPLACLAWITILSWVAPDEEAPEWRRVALLGAFGCLCGLLVNPYFPGNLVLSAIHARIPSLIKGELHGLNFGEELFPLAGDAHFEAFRFCELLLLAGVFVLGLDFSRREPGQRTVRFKLIYLLGVSGLFLALSFQTMRAGEYLIPVSGLLLVLLLERFRDQPRLSGALVFAISGFQIFFIHGVLKDRATSGVPLMAQATMGAISAIPATPRGAKVFNCEWDSTPYLFHLRPDLRFVDILDPSLLYFSNPGAFRLRQDLGKGLVGDALGMIRQAFHADYVLCRNETILSQLRDDPGFQQIYPSSADPAQGNGVPTVFRVSEAPAPAYVRVLDLFQMAKVPASEIPALAPRADQPADRVIELDRSTYLNLAAVRSEKNKSEVPALSTFFLCAFVAPNREELARLRGADYLVLGGGQGFEVWKNGEHLFRTHAGFPTLRSTQVMVPLGAPLGERDRLDILVCSSETALYWGISLSLWKQDDLKKACAWKNAYTHGGPTKAPWPYDGIHTQTCLGLLAGKSIYRDRDGRGGIKR